jgi:hypothetical protein
MNAFVIESLLLAAIIAFNLGDGFLYSRITKRHGPQFNYWPGSGYYVAWKHRRK